MHASGDPVANLDHALQGDSRFLHAGAHPARRGANGSPFTQGQRLFTEDFRGGLARWTGELEKPGKVETRGRVLTVDVAVGCTLY